MDTAELKKLLAAARKNPVNCAVALDHDKDVIIELNKTKSGAALLKQLQAEDKDLGLGVFGTVSVNENDPKCATFELNKSPASLVSKLEKALKGTGITKVTLE